MDLTMKNDDNEYWRYTLNYAFIDVKTMNIHQKTIFFSKKTMKPYSEAVILSI